MTVRHVNSVISSVGGLSLLLALLCHPLRGQEWSVPVAPNTNAQNSPVSPDTATLAPGAEEDILNLDIDQLGQVDVVVPSFDLEVTSVARRASTVGKSPAAVFVITQEMIRRSGATSIPELLRMAPGVQVARIDANQWAITARGFNSRFANKLLVLIDGRSVYTPLFSGVYWDVQDTLLQDIDRIEVIRGPGATLWGANAVNGVINIITKKAKETQGALITSGGGSEENAMNGLRYGGNVGSNFHYRVYGKHFDRDTGFDPAGAHDDWRQGRVGFRTDWELDEYACDTLTFQGDYYDGSSGTASHFPTLTPPGNSLGAGDIQVSGGNFLTRWTHRFDEESELTLQLYYDRAERRSLFLDQEIDIFDVDLAHHFPLSDRHGLTWGLHFRRVSDDLGSPDPFVLRFDPPRRQTDLASAFVQDEITLIDETLMLTLGSKFEHNEFTGFEFQPSGRLLWTPDRKHALWASVSRAVRTPARSEDDMRLVFANIAPSPPMFLAIFGDRNIESEDLLAYEIGFREQTTDEFSWDLALFFNDYNDLMAFAPGTPVLPPPALIIPSVPTNRMDGETYGVELAADYAIANWWRVHGSYSFLQMQLHADAGTAADAESAEGESPHNQAFLQSSWDLPGDLEFDLMGRYVDNLPALNVSNYITLDLRLGYRPNESWEFSVVGQNLLEEHHQEFSSQDPVHSEVDRGVYAQAIWRR